MTLHYQDNQEKRYLFYYMLGVLDKLKIHEIEIYNLVFDALKRWGEDYMIIILYQKMLNKKLIPPYLVHTMILQVLKMTNKKKDNTVEDQSSEYFRKRTFKMPHETQHFTNKINLLVNAKCLECENSVNIEEVLIYLTNSYAINSIK